MTPAPALPASFHVGNVPGQNKSWPYAHMLGRRLLGRFHPASYALNRLDKLLLRNVHRRGGYFIEAGANDGILQSNTLFLEYHMGWRGLLIEALPDQARACQRNRPNCIVEHVALIAPDFPGRTIRLHAAGLMSTVDGALKTPDAQELHLRDAVRDQGLTRYEVDVPTSTLGALLDRHDIRQVDLLCLDVEGYEANVLRGLDFNRHQPTFMLIEARFRRDVEAVIGRYYKVLAELTSRDVLYRRSNDAGRTSR